MNRTARISLNLAAVAVLALFVWWATSGNNINGYTLQILNLIAINIILALSLNLIYGFTGMFSLGHAGFMAVGAYVCSILILAPAQKEAFFIIEPAYGWVLNAHAPFFVAVVAGGIGAALVGLLVGLPLLKLGDDYLGIATLGVAEIIRVVANNLIPITNGSLGFKGIPQHANLWWNAGWMLVTFYVITRLLASNTGNVLRAVRDDETAAKAMGINVFRAKLLSFTVGSFFAGVGGALLASLLTTIDPKMFLFTLTFNVLMIVVTGGLGSITGSILGGIAITVLLEWLRVVENPISIGSFSMDGIPGMRMVVFSLALIIIILFKREGIMGMREFSWSALTAPFRKKGAAK